MVHDIYFIIKLIYNLNNLVIVLNEVVFVLTVRKDAHFVCLLSRLKKEYFFSSIYRLVKFDMIIKVNDVSYLFILYDFHYGPL